MQNPSPNPPSGQDYVHRLRLLTDEILAQFLKVLPSNYLSKGPGASYVLQFQAIAEQIAAFQIEAEEVSKDSTHSKTRTDFLWQVIGNFVFPDATDVPSISGDVAYRDFLRRMVALLLSGSSAQTMGDGVSAMSDSDVHIIERFIESMKPGSSYTIDDQFFVDILVETAGGTTFPVDPGTLSSNVLLVMRALKPAHVLYGYSHLFRETFGSLFDDGDTSWEMSSYYYEDFRKYCGGIKAVTGTAGATLSGRNLFSDTTRSFQSVRVGAVLVITTGPNAGPYRVREVLRIPYPSDERSRSYTTSPTGLSGSATTVNGILVDPLQDFSSCVEGEMVTISSGPNAGSYRIEMLLGPGGGIPGLVDGPSSKVRLDYSMLRIEGRMPHVTSSQSYTVDVDRLGVKEPRHILNEDVSGQFYR